MFKIKSVRADGSHIVECKIMISFHLLIQSSWFDADNERTERYTLYEIPFYTQRIQSLRIFTTNDEIEAFLAPFQKKQLELKNK